LPRRPVHAWQVWNEENFKYFVVRPNPAEYGRLVKRSARAIRAVDPHADVILGGLFARPGEATRRLRPPQAYFAADFLRRMYRRTPGVRAAFDGVALHPYSASYRRLAPEIEEVRAALRAGHDPGAPLWITELGWSSEHPSRRDSFAKGPQGQAAQLKGAFSLLRSHRARWRLRRVYWFSVDDAPGLCNFCGGSGLFGPGFRPKPAWHAYVRFAS
jgi:polysaccharide biosynthesis protein PslG